MKKITFLSTLLISLLILTSPAFGQYTGSNADVVAGKPASATDSLGLGFGPGQAVDRNPGTFLGSAEDTLWLDVDLGALYMLDGFGFDALDPTGRVGGYSFSVSVDGVAWTELGTGTVSAAGAFSFDITETDPVSFIRFKVLSKLDPIQVVVNELYAFGTELQIPLAPNATDATNVTSTSFTANWDARDGADGYVILWADNAAFADSTAKWVAAHLSDDVTDLIPGTTYYYKLRSYNAAGTGAYGNTIAVTLLKEAQDISFGALDAAVYGDADVELTATASSGLDVSYASSDETVATVAGSTMTIVGVGTTTITASQEGNDMYLAAAQVDQGFEVSIKALTVTGTEAADKIYDGTTDAVLSGAVLEGAVEGDEVVMDGADAGTFAQAEVGTAIEVSFTMSLSGADAGFYSLTLPAALSADIAAAELTVSGAVAANKVYDGTTDAVVSGATLEGVIGDDVVTLTGDKSGEFAQAGIGTGIAVTLAMDLAGAAKDNYVLTAPAAVSADIAAAELTVTADDKSREKCFDNPEFTFAYSGFIGTEDESVVETAPTASCTADSESAAGSYDITVAGGSAVNYSLVYVVGTLTVTPDVTAPVLEVKDISVQVPESGTISITADEVVTNTADNCGVGEITLSQSDFTNADEGVVDVEVTLADVNGNTTVAVAKVTVVAWVGIDDAFKVEARVYPNPTYGQLQLELDRPADGLRVMDLTGKTVMSKASVGMEDSIDLEEFNAGIYVIALQFGDEVVYYKVMKK